MKYGLNAGTGPIHVIKSGRRTHCRKEADELFDELDDITGIGRKNACTECLRAKHATPSEAINE